MSHPVITHINDVLPHIEARSDFIVADKGDYTVIDYVYSLADSFDDPVRVECRGLKFSPDGAILARPLHKFFNINERPDTQAGVLDFSQPHTVMEKLDGSMIHPAIVNGDVVFMTRMGRTDVAIKAERHLTAEVYKSCHLLLNHGVTPIFEFTAPDNRIVVRYDESRLTLIAIRKNYTGAYYPRSVIADWATDMGIALVPVHDSAANGADFTAYARAILGIEGFVVRFDNGLWVKAKGDDYVLKHRAKDSILQEKNILQMVLSGSLDDVLPLLDEPDADAAKAYRDAVETGVSATISSLHQFVAANQNVPQKEFALDHVRRLPKLMQPLAFTIRKGVDAGEAVRAYIIANATSQTRVDECRELHNASWAV